MVHVHDQSRRLGQLIVGWPDTTPEHWKTSVSEQRRAQKTTRLAHGQSYDRCVKSPSVDVEAS